MRVLFVFLLLVLVGSVFGGTINELRSKRSNDCTSSEESSTETVDNSGNASNAPNLSQTFGRMSNMDRCPQVQMRVHLLLVLFFASIVLARNARYKRDTNTATLATISATEASTEKPTTEVTGNKSDGSNSGNNNCTPFKTMSKLIRSIITNISNILTPFIKALEKTGNFFLQPFVKILKMIIEIMQSILQYL